MFAAILCALVPGAVAAAPATAEVANGEPIQHFLINGAGARVIKREGLGTTTVTHGGLRVRVAFNFEDLPELGRRQHSMEVQNLISNAAGNVITGLEATIDSSSGGVAGFPEDPFGWCTASSPNTGFGCDLSHAGSIPAPPGAFTSPAWVTTDQNFTGGLSKLNVIFNNGTIGACAGEKNAFVAVAEAGCTPPSHTRITAAKIRGRRAFFRFTARRATKFECTLWRGQRKFRRKCNGSKLYPAAPPGNYVFTVWGINRAGIDAKPAVKRFTIR